METYSSVPRFTRVNPIPPEARGRPLQVKAPNDRFEDDDDSDEDSDEETITAEDLAKRSDGRFSTHFIPLVSSGVPVCGFVRIVAPPGRVVPHNGIKASLETNLFALEELATRDIYTEEIQIAGPGEITGTVDLPFAFLNTANAQLPEAYEGDLFSIRHKISLGIERPWYTFNVAADAPFAIQSVHHLPRAAVVAAANRSASEASDGAGAGAGAGAGVGQGKELSTPSNAASRVPTSPVMSPKSPSMEPLSPTMPLPSELSRDGSIFGPQVMGLDGMEQGASIALRIDRGCYEVSETLKGNIACAGLTMPVVLLKLSVVRIEYADGEAADSVIFDDAIMDARRWKARRDRARAIEKIKRLAAEREAAEIARLQAEKAAEDAADGADGGGSNAAAEAGDGANGESVHALPPTISVISGGVGDGSGASGDDDADEDGVKAVVNEWVPDMSEYESDNPDPDLPILGDVNLTVELALAQLKVTPTYVIDVAEEDEKKQPPQPSSGDDEDLNKVTVRYFVRLTAYTDFTPEARRWNAQEVVLYRGQLYGQDVPEYRLPRNIAGYGEGEDEQADVEGAHGGVSLGVMLPAPLSSGLRLFGIGSEAGSGASSADKRFGRLAPGGDVGRGGAGASALKGIMVSHGSGPGADGMDPAVADLASYITRAVSVNEGSGGAASGTAGTAPGPTAPILTEDDASMLRGGANSGRRTV